MTYTGNLGDNSVDCTQIVSLNVQPGATVTVANLSASLGTLSYFNNGLDQGASGTITAGNNQAFTAPSYLISTGGVASIQITGTGY